MDGREEESVILWCRRLYGGEGDALTEPSPSVVERLLNCRGTLIAQLGRSAVFTFELPELRMAVEEAVRALREAEGRDAPSGLSLVPSKRQPWAIGAAFGSPDDAIDRAQYLAAHSPSGHLLLDENLSSALGEALLLEPPPNPPLEHPTASLLDPLLPLEKERRAAIAKLRSPRLPPSFRPLFQTLDRYAERGVGGLIFIRASVQSGLDRLIHALITHLRPAFALEANSAPLGLEPLGGLRLAAKRGVFDEARREALHRLLHHTPPSATTLVDRSRELRRLLTPGPQERTGVVFIDPLGGADLESERLLIEAIDDARILVIARIPSDREAPSMLHGREPDLTLEMPELKEGEAIAFSAAILGVSEDDPGARCVASPRDAQLEALLETARAAIFRGELILEEGGAFRHRPRPLNVGNEPASRLAMERVESLESLPLRLLELISMIAPGTSYKAIEAAARLDEASDEGFRIALAQLRREHFVHPEELRPLSEIIRAATLRAMAPSRRAELHRLIAAALEQVSEGELASITQATHLRAGGRSKEAAALLLSASEHALALESNPALNRLLAKAIEWDPSDATREKAHQLSRRVRAPNGRKASLIEAFSSNQLRRAEAIIDAAITDGLDLEIAASLRALLETRRGDPLSAQRLLEGRSLETPPGRWVYAFTKLFTDPELALDDYLALLRDARRRRSAEDEEASLLGVLLYLEAVGEDGSRLAQRLRDSRIASSKRR